MNVAEPAPVAAQTPGVTGAVAVIYCLVGLGFLIAIAIGTDVSGQRLRWSDAWLAVLIFGAGIGVLRRTVWGRWLGYLFSLPLILGVPVGTLLGGFMILHLTRYRAVFTKWY
jgi:hypothetical protein